MAGRFHESCYFSRTWKINPIFQYSNCERSELSSWQGYHTTAEFDGKKGQIRGSDHWRIRDMGEHLLPAVKQHDSKRAAKLVEVLFARGKFCVSDCFNFPPSSAAFYQLNDIAAINGKIGQPAVFVGDFVIF